MITLPAKNTNEGAETRILLSECRGPAASGYTLANAKDCMRHMDLVLWNRLADPGKFGARGATTIAGILTAPGQFAGFAKYPNYDASIVNRIQSMLNIANSSKDKRSSDYADFINAAMAIARGALMTEPTTGTLAFWRTSGHAGPGGGATFHKTIGGIDFYFIP
jgi:hypothetical protein